MNNGETNRKKRRKIIGTGQQRIKQKKKTLSGRLWSLGFQNIYWFVLSDWALSLYLVLSHQIAWNAREISNWEFKKEEKRNPSLSSLNCTLALSPCHTGNNSSSGNNERAPPTTKITFSHIFIQADSVVRLNWKSAHASHRIALLSRMNNKQSIRTRRLLSLKIKTRSSSSSSTKH